MIGVPTTVFCCDTSAHLPQNVLRQNSSLFCFELQRWNFEQHSFLSGSRNRPTSLACDLLGTTKTQLLATHLMTTLPYFSSRVKTWLQSSPRFFRYSTIRQLASKPRTRSASPDTILYFLMEGWFTFTEVFVTAVLLQPVLKTGAEWEGTWPQPVLFWACSPHPVLGLGLQAAEQASVLPQGLLAVPWTWLDLGRQNPWSADPQLLLLLFGWPVFCCPQPLLDCGCPQPSFDCGWPHPLLF